MKAAVWYKQRDLRVEERELKGLKAHEVRVKVAWAGICGSDLHEYEDGPVFAPTEEPDPLTGDIAPFTMGHEFAGVVEETGEGVKHFKSGDRVAINPTITYGDKGEDVDIYYGSAFIGLSTDGGFAEFTNVPESNLCHLPEPLTLQDGALVEPTAVAVQAVKEANLVFGDTVAVFGAGPIGLLTVIAAKAAGASRIIVLDLSEERLNKAQEAGATEIINPAQKDAVEAINKLEPEGVDVSFEVAGVGTTFQQAVEVTKPRGTMIVVSIFAKPIEWNPFQLTGKGITIKSSLAYTPTSFQQTIDLMANHQLKPQMVITDKLNLNEIVDKGFEELANNKSQAKILVKLSGAM